MKLTLKRTFKGTDYTIGKLYIDGKYFCDTLEDTVRKIKPDGTGKIYGKTAILAGTYSIILSKSAKFGKILPLLLDTPHFKGVRIHSGNRPEDTEGCILVGENKAKGQVLYSRPTMARLMQRLQDAESKQEPISIEIV